MRCNLPSLRKRLEAVLFVATEPATLEQLVDATGEAVTSVKTALKELSAVLHDRGIIVREVGGGYRLTSNPDCRDDVERFLLPPKTHMSPASLETLAIVAYLQPVTRAEIESIRGVNADGVMGTLEQRRLVEETIAKHCALLIATLKRFGLNRNSVPRGASSPRDVVIETITTAAC